LLSVGRLRGRISESYFRRFFFFAGWNRVSAKR